MDIYNFILNNELSLFLGNYFSPPPDKAVWGPRSIDDYELIYQVDGSGKYSDQNNHDFTLLIDEVLLIPPDITHTFRCSREIKSTISCIHLRPLNSLPTISPCKFSVRHDFEILNLFKKCSREYARKIRINPVIQNAMLSELLIRIVEADQISSNEIKPQIILNSLKFIEDNFHESISRSSIAESNNITPEYLNYLFKIHLGTTPNALILKKKIEHAKRLLNERRLSVKETSAAVGFEDPLYFSKVFKKATGFCPKKWSENF